VLRAHSGRSPWPTKPASAPCTRQAVDARHLCGQRRLRGVGKILKNKTPRKKSSPSSRSRRCAGAAAPASRPPQVELHAAFRPGQKYIVCNSDEGEPGTCKDRDILRFNPHAVIEGMAIAGYTIGATVGYNYIRGEFWEPYERFSGDRRSARRRPARPEYSRQRRGLRVAHASRAGAYICGEETALLESIEARRANRASSAIPGELRPVRPADDH